MSTTVYLYCEAIFEVDWLVTKREQKRDKKCHFFYFTKHIITLLEEIYINKNQKNILNGVTFVTFYS